MVRTFRMGLPLLALALTSTLRAQGPYPSSPYGGGSPAPRPFPSAAAPAPREPQRLRSAPDSAYAPVEPLKAPPLPAPSTRAADPVKAPPVPVKPGESVMTVQESGRPPLLCRIVKSWRTPAGVQVYEVQAIETGERMTIEEKGTLATPPSAGRPHLRAVATQIYHWGRSSHPPAEA